MLNVKKMQDCVDRIVMLASNISMKFIAATKSAAAYSENDYTPAKRKELADEAMIPYNDTVFDALASMRIAASDLEAAAAVPFDATDGTLIGWVNALAGNSDMPMEVLEGIRNQYTGNAAALKLLAKTGDAYEKFFNKRVEEMAACAKKMTDTLNEISRHPENLPVSISHLRDALILYSQCYGVSVDALEVNPSITEMRTRAIASWIL